MHKWYIGRVRNRGPQKVGGSLQPAGSNRRGLKIIQQRQLKRLGGQLQRGLGRSLPGGELRDGIDKVDVDLLRQRVFEIDLLAVQADAQHIESLLPGAELGPGKVHVQHAVIQQLDRPANLQQVVV